MRNTDLTFVSYYYCPQKTLEDKPTDPRCSPYKPGAVPIPDETKCEHLCRELKLLSKLKRREPFNWLDDERSLCSLDKLMVWEAAMQFALPPHFRYLIRKLGGVNIQKTLCDKKNWITEIHKHAYSPWLALLPIDEIGFTEINSRMDVRDDAFLDDDRVATLLDKHSAGHEFDDEIVCEQLCGGLTDARIRVLLVGAPLDLKIRGRHDVTNSRMFLNIRPGVSDSTVFCGDGLLYRLDGWGEESELVKIGTALDWLESCFVSEVDERLVSGDPGKLIHTRYPQLAQKRMEELQKKKNAHSSKKARNEVMLEEDDLYGGET